MADGYIVKLVGTRIASAGPDDPWTGILAPQYEATADRDSGNSLLAIPVGHPLDHARQIANCYSDPGGHFGSASWRRKGFTRDQLMGIGVQRASRRLKRSNKNINRLRLASLGRFDPARRDLSQSPTALPQLSIFNSRLL